jgi:plastocyanin
VTRTLRIALLALAGLLAQGHAQAATVLAQILDAAGAPLRDAAVYLVPTASAKRAFAPARAVIEQRDRDFIPFVTVVRTGTAVTFPNRDQTMHHVYSFSPAKSFQIKLYEGDPPNPIVFDKPGVVAVGCNIHDWMQAYVLVVNTPHFALTDDSGRARIEGLGNGAYVVHVWHPHARAEWEAPLRIDGERTPVNATLSVRAPARKPKPPLDITKY